jgi:hypothetical protein
MYAVHLPGEQGSKLGWDLIVRDEDATVVGEGEQVPIE